MPGKGCQYCCQAYYAQLFEEGDSSCFYTMANIPWGMKEDCHIPAPGFYCKTMYSLIKISEKLWYGARNGEFKDQEWGEIPVSHTTLNHFYSHCRSSGLCWILCCTERLSFPLRIYKAECHSWLKITGHPLPTLCFGKPRWGGGAQAADGICCPGAPLLHGIGLSWVCSWSAQLYGAGLSGSLTTRSQHLDYTDSILVQELSR